MDEREWKSDRKDALRSLSEAVARGAFEVLRPTVQRALSSSHRIPAQHDGRASSRDCFELDMRARCEHCGSQIAPGSRADRKYCSPKCRYSAANALDAAARKVARAGRACARCDSVISADRPARAKYCSDRCQKRASNDREKARAKHRKICPTCQREFGSRYGHQVHCSPPCARAQEFEIRSSNLKAQWASGVRDHLRGKRR